MQVNDFPKHDKIYFTYTRPSVVTEVSIPGTHPAILIEFEIR